jgi:hypothetical protein
VLVIVQYTAGYFLHFLFCQFQLGLSLRLFYAQLLDFRLALLITPVYIPYIPLKLSFLGQDLLLLALQFSFLPQVAIAQPCFNLLYSSDQCLYTGISLEIIQLFLMQIYTLRLNSDSIP